MRLIDADALKESLIQFFPEEALEGITFKTGFKQILTDIDNEQTIDPMNHGHWMNIGMARKFETYDSHTHYDGLNCSLCERYGESRMKYCPWCGAVMDQEGEYREID